MRDTTAEDSSSRCGRYFSPVLLALRSAASAFCTSALASLPLSGITREAALHVHRDAAAIDGERRAEHFDHLLLHPVHGFVFVAGGFHDEAKGAAAEMRQQFGGIEVALQAIGHLLQQQVAGVPAEGIVDGRQLFDVEHRHRRRAAPADARLERAHQRARRTGRAWRDRSADRSTTGNGLRLPCAGTAARRTDWRPARATCAILRRRPRRRRRR